jgi:hypothetical protein
MDTATAQPALVSPTPSELEVEAAEHSPGEEYTPEKLFELSRWIHVGEGAEECPHATDGECEDVTHFHAWCRLPNQFQHEAIREKALAAKARRIRLLKDPESDAYVIVEFALDELRATGDIDSIVEEIVRKDTMKVHLAAVTEMRESEEFAHIEEDRERLRSLEAEPEETRNADEVESLRRHIKLFEDTLAQKKEEVEGPHREGLKQNSLDDLLDMVRQDRIERDGSRQFMDIFSRWVWFLGTMRKATPPKAANYESERYFASIKHMEVTADEVLNALDNTFAELEARLAAQGKGS